MAKCEICGKGVTFGHNVPFNRSHSGHRTNRMWKPNIRNIKALINGSPKTVSICSRCLKSGAVTRAQ